ncbi:uncharacterized protein LOC111277490 [Durio zibethinus]|uniref:Uncharacterized protein LOC111277490 n=1 Tax=Durio zibethinus TaxID=66656 RepID=A0A6P5WUZ7_DURZI|nr:uncharacterized protein LOC111277490 [Durio zibethinus]
MKKEESNVEPSYEDFEPYCKWIKEAKDYVLKEADILEIQLQEFKREELKYEMGEDRLLYIRGEHQVGKSLIRRFNKKIDVSKYNIKEIEAKFEAGNLNLRLPCKNSALSFCKMGKKTINCAMVALLLLLAFCMYRYSE